MAVVSVRSDLRLQDAGNLNFREWVSTAAVQDTAAGGSVMVTTVTTTGGATAPTQADVLTLELYIDNGNTLIVSQSLTPGTASQTSTFFFTDTGLTGGVARAGTVRMRIHAVNTTASLAANRYNVDTDLVNNTPPTGFTVATHDQGWIRGTTTSTGVLSNVSAGGAKNSPVEARESLFVRTTLGAALYSARALTAGITPTVLTATTNSASSGNFDATIGGIVDNRYPAAATVESSTVAVPNATLTGQPDFTVVNTADTITVDPRLNGRFYMQLDDSTTHTPPMSAADANHDVTARANGNVGGILCRVTGSRGNGINGVSWTHSMLDNNSPPFSTEQDAQTATTATLNGTAGMDPAIFNWVSGLPGGGWNCLRTLNGNMSGLAATPASPTSRSMTATSTSVLRFQPIMLVPSPDIGCVVTVGPTTAAADKDHTHDGDAMVFSVHLQNNRTGVLVPADSSPAPSVEVQRWNPDLNRLEYLDAGGVWQDATGGVNNTFLTTQVGATAVWTVTLSVVGVVDLRVKGIAYQNLTPYVSGGFREMVSKANQHSALVYDVLAAVAVG